MMQLSKNEMKKNVLVPIDDEYFYPNWVEGYRDAGLNVFGGMINFWNIGSIRVDFLHIQWPEFMTRDYRVSDEMIEKIVLQMDLWRSEKVKIIGSVNNLYPHGKLNDPVCRRLYENIYGRCDLVHHFSNAARSAFNDYYPSLRGNKQIVSSLAGYTHLFKKTIYSGVTRKNYNIKNNEFVILVFGALRSYEEWSLVKRAFGLVRIENKRLLMTQKYNPHGNFIYKNLNKLLYKYWIKISGAAILPDSIPDEGLRELFDIVDLVVVPRIDDISSGIPALAMTMGVMVVAPGHGAFPEYLSGTGNLLYDSGSASSLAEKITQSFYSDRKKIGYESCAIAKNWSWEKIVRECLSCLE